MGAQTSANLVTFLTPFLPYLLKMGEKAAEEVGEKLGGEAWEKAKSLWAKLRSKERVVTAAQAAASLPDNPDVEKALRTEIARALEEDETLRREIARLWQEAEAAGVTVVASGDRAVAIGGDVSGSTIITGDQNAVQQGKYNVQIDQATGVAIGDQAQVSVQKGIVLVPVESSMVHAVGYDPRTSRLEVVFTSGRTYCYEDVPPEVFQGLLEAESKGRYMRAYIIDVYPYRRGPCPKKR